MIDQRRDLKDRSYNNNVKNTTGELKAGLNSDIMVDPHVTPLPDVVRQEKENIAESQV